MRDKPFLHAIQLACFRIHIRHSLLQEVAEAHELRAHRLGARVQTVPVPARDGVLRGDGIRRVRSGVPSACMTQFDPELYMAAQSACMLDPLPHAHTASINIPGGVVLQRAFFPRQARGLVLHARERFVDAPLVAVQHGEAPLQRLLRLDYLKVRGGEV